MIIAELPYGREKMRIRIPKERFAGSACSEIHSYIPGGTGEELVEQALRNPTGSPGLASLAAGKKDIVLLASDHTRPVPSKILIPRMLREIRRGNPQAEITILVATGCHRTTTHDELREKFGEEILRQERIVVHDCDDRANLEKIGVLPSGGELVINALAARADLLVSEGFIEPHFFAGFSGGRKSVLPGIASRKSVLHNHNAGFIHDPCARTGILDNNPIHADMEWAARQAKLAFICNVVLGSDKEIVYAVAGDPEQAHRKGCRFLEKLCRICPPRADIVVTTNGGYPLDQNIYQAVKGMTAAETAVKPGGVIIIAARSEDGHGGKSFYETFRDEPDAGRLMERFLATPADQTIVDQWQSQIFARVLLHADVIYLSDAPDSMVRDLHMTPAHSFEEALEQADRILEARGIKAGRILVIPDGVSVIAQ